MWPILGDRWIMGSPDGTLFDVPFNHLVALRDVTEKQSHPREAQHTDQFELPDIDDDLLNWVRQGQEAVIFSRENLLSPPTSSIPEKTGSVRLCRCKTSLCGPLFVGSLVKLLVFRSSLLNRCQVRARRGIHGFTACRTS